MSEQTSIAFVPVTPVVHRDDPHTSALSARQVTRDGTRAKQAAEVLRLVREHPGLTSYEYADHSENLGRGLDRHQIARRLPELADVKNGGPFVERGEARACLVTGFKALTWWPTNGGTDGR